MEAALKGSFDKTLAALTTDPLIGSGDISWLKENHPRLLNPRRKPETATFQPCWIRK